MTTENPPIAMRALRATYEEARAGREAAQSLSPLLALLEPSQPGEESPLDEVTRLLATILRTQERTLAAVEALAARVEGRMPR